MGPPKTREYWPHGSARGQQGYIQEFKCRAGSTLQESTCIYPKSSQPGWRNVTAIQEHPARRTTPQRSIPHQAKSSSNSEAPRASGICSDILPYSNSSSSGLLPFRVRISVLSLWPILHMFGQLDHLSAFTVQRILPRWVICKSSTLSNLCDTEMSLWTLIFRVCDLGELQGRITTHFLRTIWGKWKVEALQVFQGGAFGSKQVLITA